MEKPFEESWFYAPLHAVGERALLTEEDSRHLRKALRVPPGRCVVASNGVGGVFLCLTGEKGQVAELTAIEMRIDETVPPRLNLVLSLLKGKDLEEPVEGLCQLAVDAIHLVTTDHTQEFKGQDHHRLVERLAAKSIVALKQAKKPWLTRIHAPVPLRKWREANLEMPLVLLHPGADRLPATAEGSFAILSGPEGGFSSGELEWLNTERCHQIGLGPTRIRGTHAPLLACGKLMGLGLI